MTPARRLRSLAALLVAATCAAPAVRAAEPLLPGTGVDGRLAGGEAAEYECDLAAGTAWLLVVEQRQGGVTTEVVTPAGDTLHLDGPLGEPARESLVLRPAAGGTHRLRVIAGGSSEDVAFTLSLAALGDDDPRLPALELESSAGLAYAAGGAEDRGRARDLYARAAEAWSEVGDGVRSTECRHALALLERADGDARRAVELLARVAEDWQRLGHPGRHAEALNSLGLARWRLGDAAAAGRDFERSREIFHRLGDRDQEAGVASNLCLVFHSAGRLDEAERCYLEALRLLAELGQVRNQGVLLNNLGGVHQQRGEPEAASGYFERSLVLRRESGDRRGEAETLNNLAVLHRTLGEFEDAVLVYEQVLAIQRQEGDRRGEGRTLSNMGYAYLTLGEGRRAVSFLERALVLRREVGDRRGEAATLANLGEALHAVGRDSEALARLGEALHVQRQREDRSGEAVVLTRRGDLRHESGEPRAALADYERAIELLDGLGHRHNAALARAGRAAAHTALGDLAAARRDWAAVLEVARAIGARQLEARAHHGLARVEQAADRPAAALAEVEATLALLESLRADLAPADLRASFLATQRDVYELEIELRMATGDPEAALLASERSRARTLLDVVRGAGIAAGGADGRFEEARRSVERTLRAKAVLRRDVDPEEEPDEAAALDAEIDELSARLENVEAQARREDPRFAELVRPPTLTVAEIRSLLDAETVLVEISLGARRSFLWWVTHDGVEAVELPPGAEIESAARRVHEALREPGTGAAQDADLAELGRLLLAGVADRLASCGRLVVVPDGALHYVPMAAVPVPAPAAGEAAGETVGEALLDRCREVVHLPSAAVLAAQRRELAGRAPAPRAVAVVADPVFSPADPRLERAPGDLPAGEPSGALGRLRFSRREAEAIAGTLPPGRTLLALDFAADRETVVDGGLDDYRVVHFATHGLVDDRHPALSALVLSQVDRQGRPRPGLVSLRDVYALDLRAELVVLSGCETALGREVGGEGLVGLTRGFMYAGAPRVVASLWRVEDRTTARLMEVLYAALVGDGLAPAAALREAQLEVRRRRPDPYFWAPFVLQGDWRPFEVVAGGGETSPTTASLQW